MSRREALALVGSAVVAARASWSSAAVPALSCIASPAQTEGPYFVDERLNRSDIRSEPADDSMREGVPLTLLCDLVSTADPDSLAINSAERPDGDPIWLDSATIVRAAHTASAS